MTSIKPDLLDILACPDCGGHLNEDKNKLHCSGCQRSFSIQNGIPLLYPESLDVTHLREETLLAELMHQSKTGKRAKFNSEQWAMSKREFWNMVEKHLNPSQKNILYIGSGYDTGFQRFQGKHLFVNLDLIVDMLDTLRNQKAEACIAGDMNALPFQKNSFDAIITIDILHHESEHLKKILKIFTDLLKPGGTLFIEDINAWGLFQLIKSIMMPKPLYRSLRSLYHRFKHSHYSPAEYEFPTSYWQIKRILKTFGFHSIQAHQSHAYPYLNFVNFKIYKWFSLIKPVSKYLNYHYILSAEKSKT